MSAAKRKKMPVYVEPLLNNSIVDLNIGYRVFVSSFVNLSIDMSVEYVIVNIRDDTEVEGANDVPYPLYEIKNLTEHIHFNLHRRREHLWTASEIYENRGSILERCIGI